MKHPNIRCKQKKRSLFGFMIKSKKFAFWFSFCCVTSLLSRRGNTLFQFRAVTDNWLFQKQNKASLIYNFMPKTEVELVLKNAILPSELRFLGRNFLSVKLKGLLSFLHYYC